MLHVMPTVLLFVVKCFPQGHIAGEKFHCCKQFTKNTVVMFCGYKK